MGEVHWVGIVKRWVGIMKKEDGWLVRKEGYFCILKFIYPYNQFYMISWVLGLNWVSLSTLYQIRGPCAPKA